MEKKFHSKKKSIYFLISALLLIMVFGVSALCNFCAAPGKNEGKIDIDSDTNQDGQNISSEENNGEDDTDDIEADSSGKPTIKLKIHEGPLYSAEDDVCYWRVEAIVTGNPMPEEVAWSKNDTASYGSYIAQVNLTRDSPTYTLKASVKNLKGEADDSIDLKWECGGDVNEENGNNDNGNNNPQIASINLSEDTIYPGEVYSVTAQASDPDGDSISFKWSVSGGSIANDSANPMLWTTPGSGGSCTITLKVTDGIGGADEDSKEVIIKEAVSAAQGTTIKANMSESGTVEENGFVGTGWVIIVGDSETGGPLTGDRALRGFISFDISALSGLGATVKNANIKLKKQSIHGDPSVLGILYLEKVNWGAEALVLGDFNLASSPLCSYSSYGDGNLSCNSAELKTQLQNAINNGASRFQARLNFAQSSDGDNITDSITYPWENCELFVEYE